VHRQRGIHLEMLGFVLRFYADSELGSSCAGALKG
jgi:hypothetical protein